MHQLVSPQNRRYVTCLHAVSTGTAILGCETTLEEDIFGHHDVLPVHGAQCPPK